MGLRIVVKVGTSTLTNQRGGIDRGFIADLTAQLATQQAKGHEVLLVTSGAIRAGRERLEQRAEDTSLPYKQAAAAIGQGRLIRAYTEAFDWRETDCAQVLLSRDDLADRRRFLNARNTLLALLELGVVPIINENDTVAVDEIKFGDNDMLAALVATLIEADLLLILSDVEGLYARPPDPASSVPPDVIPLVERFDETISALGGGSASGVGTGGMRTKLEAARIATAAGIRAVIAKGRRERIIEAVVSGECVGTTFLPVTSAERLPARKRWIAYSALPQGWVTVNARAKGKLQSEGVSLLAVGITQVGGSFTEGDLIEVRDENGVLFARGLTNYPDVDVKRVLGKHSEEFEETLGYRGFEEIIHRDNLFVENGG